MTKSDKARTALLVALVIITVMMVSGCTSTDKVVSITTFTVNDEFECRSMCFEHCKQVGRFDRIETELDKNDCLCECYEARQVL